MPLMTRLGVILGLAVIHFIVWMGFSLAFFGQAIDRLFPEGQPLPPPSTAELNCDAIAAVLGFPGIQIIESNELWRSWIGVVLFYGNSFVWAALIFGVACFLCRMWPRPG